MKIFLWVWAIGSSIKSGYEFSSKKDAEIFFYHNFHDEPVNHEIKEE